MLFCKGVNDDEKSIEKLINVLSNVEAEKVQLGTIHRPPAYENIEKVDDEFLLTTANLLKKHKSEKEIETSLNMLLSQGIIKAVDYNNDTYYTL